MKQMRIIILALGILLFAQAAQADWIPARRLTWTSGDSFSPAVAVDSGNAINVVWSDYTPGNSEVFFKRSEDGGATWTEGKRLTFTSGDCYEPAIALDSSDTIHVAWDSDAPGNYEIYYIQSTDGGANWSAVQRLTWSSGWSEYPAIAIDSSDRIHIAWQDDKSGNLEIYSIRSTNGGANWGTVKRLTWNSGSSGSPAIARGAPNTIPIVWQDNTGTPGYSEIYFKKSTDGGQTWSGAKKLTSNAGDSREPGIARDAVGGIHVVWNDGTPGNPEIHYKKSADGGTTWGVVRRLTWSPGQSEYPVVAIASDGVVHVVWDDDDPGNYEIHHKKSTDGGSTWNSVQRLTWSTGASIVAAVARDAAGKVHVVWEDNTPGNSEIYYKNGN